MAMKDELELGEVRRSKPRDVRLDPVRKASGGGGGKQAVLKVTSYSKGSHQAVRNHVDYITRNGVIPLEMDDGSTLNGTAAGRDLTELWGSEHLGPEKSLEAEKGRTPRNAVHLMLSNPQGTDPETARRLARDFLHREFGDVTRYAFALHSDTEHPHVHAVLAIRGYDGKKLRLNRAALQGLRERYAETSRAFGIAVVATSRASRMVGQAREDARNRAVYHVEKRGEVSHAYRASVRRALRSPDRENASEKRFRDEAEKAHVAGLRAIADLRARSIEDPQRAQEYRVAAEYLEEVSKNGRAKNRAEQFLELVAKSVESPGSHPLDKPLGHGLPTLGMATLADEIARENGVELPSRCLTNFEACRAFLNDNATRSIQASENDSRTHDRRDDQAQEI